ncbi:uncharacterized protein RCO7_10487 [Rhynchosporium graminicola]|uniref:Asl1-like glycosyl hydrolase catalytic domain-containing protein n=1 Tax=Rhynchosporium graminicola TaxID=2792576 RepID=A0A1E1LP66_9HELO|nr:uncharacterized protein RCO7_10487 [Rhynchosporium commune]
MSVAKFLVCMIMLSYSGATACPTKMVDQNTNLVSRALAPVNSKDPKRGHSFHDSSYLQKWGGAGSQLSWAYNWDSTMPVDFPKNMEYIPMLWSTGADHVKQWTTNVNAAIARGTYHLLSFNEPDICYGGGSCMSAKDAAAAYKTYMSPFAGRAYLGAPAVTNGPSGMKWLKEFMGLCTGCQIDFVPIHWYDSATNVAYFKNYITDAHAIAGKNLWITEFNGSGTAAQKESFLRTVIPWMDSQSYILRYSWFWCDAKSTSGAIVDTKGNPTSLGKVYGFMARTG